jgi:Protein of unknown function (DUF3313)
MSHPILSRPLAMLALLALLAGCASPDPVAYKGLASSSYLAPNKQDDADRVPYAYSTQVNWRSYSRAIVEPVALYRGADNQFDDLSEEDRAALAQQMHTKFAEKLASQFQITDRPGPNTLRVKLTLTGAATNTPVLSTFTRFDLTGGLYNGVQAIRGGEGMMSGSVSYAVEIYDATTDRLLDAFVAKQYPGAYNVVATLGSLSAAETGIDKGADALAERLN